MSSLTGQNRILLFGDVHGSHGAVRVAAKAAQMLGITELVQLGDWGAGWHGKWPHCEFSSKVQRICERYEVTVTVVLGNHEPLWAVQERFRNPPRYSRIQILGRAGVIDILGHPVAWQSGAISVDRNRRHATGSKPSLWLNEGAEEWETGLIRRKARVFLSHDAPTSAVPGRHGELPSDIEALCQVNREIILAGIRRAEPRIAFHGHYHHGYSAETYHGFLQVGVANLDETWVRSTVVLDLDTLQWEFLKLPIQGLTKAPDKVYHVETAPTDGDEPER